MGLVPMRKCACNPNLGCASRLSRAVVQGTNRVEVTHCRNCWKSYPKQGGLPPLPEPWQVTKNNNSNPGTLYVPNWLAGFHILGRHQCP
jgi:hypothetical protein